ncbi:unnamed protein product [Mucor fragilis]
MFNKYIREVIFHTNRLDPSRDVAYMFADEAILRHVAMGGSWNNGSCKSREFADNNYLARHSLSVGLAGLFKVPDGRAPGQRKTVLGKITAKSKDKVLIDILQFVGTSSSSGNLSSTNIIDFFQSNDARLQKVCSNEFYNNNVKIVDIMDIRDKPNDVMVLNPYRFGTFWWMFTTNVFLQVIA